jgi:thiamine monophosphate synthase
MDMPKSSGIYLISDYKNLAIDDFLDKTEKILDIGISLFQFRDKNSKY